MYLKHVSTDVYRYALMRPRNGVKAVLLGVLVT